MTSGISKELSSTCTYDICALSFVFKERLYGMNFEKMHAFMQGLLATADKASIIFSNVVASRSFVELNPSATGTRRGFFHDLAHVPFNAPLNVDQMHMLLSYEKGINNALWVNHLCIINEINIEKDRKSQGS